MKIKNIFKTKEVILFFLLPIFFAMLIFIFPVISLFAADQYQYDSLGRLKKVTHDDGTTVEYNYDKTGNRTSSGEKVVSSNHIPNIPSNPDPYNQETGVPINPLLQWSGGDPDGASNTVTYSIYLDTNQNPTTKIGTVTQSGSVSPISFQLPAQSLLTGTVYYWKVVPQDSRGATPDPDDITIWAFTTTGC
jgi:YD repeat-containing protein